jgi:hypothetical protein
LRYRFNSCAQARRRRVPAYATVRIERPGKQAFVARLIDVSGGGARLAGAGPVLEPLLPRVVHRRAEAV